VSLKGAWVVVVSALMVAGCATSDDGQPTASPPHTSADASGSPLSPEPAPTDLAHQRPLTAGETELARMVFGDSVDCSVVLVHNHAYPLLGGFQPDDVAVTPNGEMYFPAPSFQLDFSAGSPDSARWFVHEMVHVWQYQLGYPVLERGMNRAVLRYDYDLDAPSPDARCGERCRLADFDMEQQGEIVADYVAMTTLGQATSGERRYSTADLARYRTVLADFLADPADPANLPRR